MRFSYNHIWLLFFLFFLKACFSLGQNKENQQNTEKISRRSLIRNTYESKEYFIVYASTEKYNEDRLKKLLLKVVSNTGRSNIKVIAEEELNKSITDTAPLLFVGTHTNLSILSTLKNQLPLTSHPKHFSFNNKIYNDSSDIFLLSYYPNPTNKKLPISFITGNHLDVIIDFLEKNNDVLSFGRWGFEHYQNNQRRLMGNFNNNSINWSVDTSSIFEFDSPQEFATTSEDIVFKLHDISIENERLQTLKNTVLARKKIFKQLFNVKKLPTIIYELFPNGELKGLTTSNTASAHTDFSRLTAFVAISSDQQGQNNNPEVKLWAKSSLGDTPFLLIEEGLPIYFSENWKRKGYLYWFGILSETTNNFTARNLLREKGLEDVSELVRQTVGAAFCSFLLEVKGIDFFKKVYSGKITSQEIEALEIAWNDWQNSIVYQPEERESLSTDFYWKGFNFTHEGYQIYNGYLSQQAEVSLDRLKSIGSNSVTLVPYSYMRDPYKPSKLSIPTSAGSENDASIIHSIHQAHKKGLKVLLKPQVWIGRNSWPGDVEMKSEKEWEQFFENYYKWIRHYALMASMYEVEALCLGVEFSKATLKYPDKWREIIKEIKKVYKGPITYSANWGEEFEQLSFWEELDYIGISCYYPLTKAERPTDRDLIRGFERNLSKLEKISRANSKPVLLTEIGFRSINAPWIQPHDYPGEQDADELSQERCYKIVFGCLQNESWCHGMFWWKWPTTFERSTSTDKRFTPYNKAAEKTVKKWYSKK